MGIASRSPNEGGGFSGLAAFSLLALTLVLAFVALVSLKPWATTSLVPHLRHTPGIGVEIAVGDSVAVASGGSAGMASVAVADARRAPLAATPVTGHRRRAGVQLDVSRAQPILAASPAPAPPPVEPPPAPVPVPPAPPAAAPTPVAAEPAPAPAAPALAGFNHGPTGPGTAVIDEFGPLEVCEGDEYAVALLLYVETVVGDEPTGKGLVLRFEGEGSEGDIDVEGGPIDVLYLVDELVAEAGCVRIEARPADERGPVPTTSEAPVDQGILDDPPE